MSNVPMRKGADELDGMEGRVYRGDPGPVVLDLTQNAGKVIVTVDERATYPEVVIRTKAKSGPAFDAVRRATIDRDGRRLLVRVSQQGGGGGTVISGGNIVINSGGTGRIIVNGVDVTATVNGGGGGEVETAVVLPKGSWATLRADGSAVVRGRIERLDYSGSSGALQVDEVDALEIDLSSGSAVVGKVWSKLDIQVSSGSATVAAYSGSDGKVRVSSGTVRVSATPQSRGAFDLRVSSGTLVLTGAQHLDTSARRVASGNLSVS